MSQIDAFREALESCQLEDLGYRGYPYTWNNKRPGDANTKMRLDRAVATKPWRDKFQLSTTKHYGRNGPRARPGFKFEENWLLWEDCETVIKEAWCVDVGGMHGMARLRHKIKACGADLRAWGSSKSRPNDEEIKLIQKQLEILNAAESTEESRSEYLTIQDCLNAVVHQITPNMHQILSSDFTIDEIKAALFQMGTTKAPGPDGINALFYQKFWHVVGDNVVSAVLDYLNSGVMHPDINHTNIVLIPKVKNPEKMANFRPISLCHLITDNILVAYETLHSMHVRKKGKKGSIALKLDISKAYDRVEWPFLQEGLTSLLTKVEHDGRIHGVSVCRSVPKISNLMFVDDSLLFCRATQGEVEVINEVLQARYFPRCNFLDAVESPNSSYVWKSMVAALPILKSGCCWRVGNGESIKEAAAICKIPLSRRNIADSLVWLHTKNGKYSVKSGYHVARKVMRNDDGVGSSDGCRGQQIWKQIWQLHVPNKIKIFWWRACQDILPTRVNLARRKIIFETGCQFCIREPESIIHAVWEYGVAQDVWVGCAIKVQKCNTYFPDIVALFEYVLERFSTAEVKVFLVQAWFLWNQRNTIIHGG
ncbi:uncharacterized protein LOC142612276 [Castanea sativa]|uniref:uncharacterized protein LOC142612276 n=1 Tax=Castanea sativa TaxID=21020 RepID=UPI003F64FA1C